MATAISFNTKAQLVIEKVLIYKHFLRGGTTMGLIGAFARPKSWGDIVDTTKVQLIHPINVLKFSQALNNAKVGRHHQQKIVLELAGEFYVDTKRHYFIICSSSLLMDLSMRKNYHIQNTDDQKMIQDIITQVNVD